MSRSSHRRTIAPTTPAEAEYVELGVVLGRWFAAEPRFRELVLHGLHRSDLESHAGRKADGHAEIRAAVLRVAAKIRARVA